MKKKKKPEPNISYLGPFIRIFGGNTELAEHFSYYAYSYTCLQNFEHFYYYVQTCTTFHVFTELYLGNTECLVKKIHIEMLVIKKIIKYVEKLSIYFKKYTKLVTLRSHFLYCIRRRKTLSCFSE